MKFLMYFLLLCCVQLGYSQIINKWEPVYKKKGNFNAFQRQNNLKCLDKNNVLIIDQSFANTSPFLAVTNNGGLNWDTLFKTQPFEYEFNAIAYPSKNKMIWVGDSSEYLKYENYNEYYKRTGVFYTSIDAGKKWEKTKLDSNCMLDYVVMFDENTGIINKRNVSNIYNNKVSFWDTLLYTENFFKSYTKIPVPDSLTFVSRIYMFSKDNFIIKVSNSLLQKYKYLETTDRGKTWKEFMDAYTTIDICFINNQIAFKIESKQLSNSDIYETQIYKTTNGGKDWIYCYTPSDSYWSTSYHVYRISASDEKNAIVIGSSGAIFRTNDGGLTWDKEFAPNNLSAYDLEYDNLFAVSHPDKDCAYLMGGEYILKMAGKKTLSRPLLNRYSNRISPSGIVAFWKPILGAKKYNLQIANGTDNNVYDYNVFNTPILDTIVTDTSIVMPDFEYNKCYYGRIKSISDSLESEWTIKASMFCTYVNGNYTAPPEFITPKSGDLINTLFCEFKWSSITGANEYQLQYSDNPYFYGNVATFNITNDTIFKTPNLVSGEEYYARLKVSKGTKISDWVYTSFKIADPSSVINLEVDKNIQISIYPNPANDFILLQTSENFDLSEVYNVQIFDIMGLEVGKSSFMSNFNQTSGQNRIDISYLTPGVYFIKIGNTMSRFVKI